MGRPTTRHCKSCHDLDMASLCTSCTWKKRLTCPDRFVFVSFFVCVSLGHANEAERERDTLTFCKLEDTPSVLFEWKESSRHWSHTHTPFSCGQSAFTRLLLAHALSRHNFCCDVTTTFNLAVHVSLCRVSPLSMFFRSNREEPYPRLSCRCSLWRSHQGIWLRCVIGCLSLSPHSIFMFLCFLLACLLDVLFFISIAIETGRLGVLLLCCVCDGDVFFLWL